MLLEQNKELAKYAHGTVNLKKMGHRKNRGYNHE